MTVARSRLPLPIKWHGGKYYLAPKIVALMPPHRNYVEPFAGGLSVLLAKSPDGVSEVVNDLDADLTTLWRVLADTDQFAEFYRVVEATPFSQREWQDSATTLSADDPDPIRRAVAFYVRCRQSLAGRGDSFAPLSTGRTRRAMNEQVSAWLTAVEGLPAVHARLKRLAVLNSDARDVIRRFDEPNTVIYCDPPYLPATRTAPDVYTHEMSRDQHADLLRVLGAVQHAAVLLSGYRNEMYDAALSGWTRHEFDLPNNAAGGAEKRRMVECVWSNVTRAGGSPTTDTTTPTED